MLAMTFLTASLLSPFFDEFKATFSSKSSPEKKRLRIILANVVYEQMTMVAE